MRQLYRASALTQLQARFASAVDHSFQVLCLLVLLAVVAGGALQQQAIQQEGIQEPYFRRIDTYRQKRADIDTADLDILDTAADQGIQRGFTGSSDSNRSFIRELQRRVST